MSLLQMAVLHMDASATSIIYSGNPVFALAAAHLILHEPLKRNHLIAIGVELIGILFILNPAKLEVSPRGFAEILTATILFAMYGTSASCASRGSAGWSSRPSTWSSAGWSCSRSCCSVTSPPSALSTAVWLDIFADVPFFTGFTPAVRAAAVLRRRLLRAAIGFLLTAKITEYTSATEASFVYLIKPVLATLLAVVCFHEAISVNRMIGLSSSSPPRCASACPCCARCGGTLLRRSRRGKPIFTQKSSGRFHGRSFFIRSQKSTVPSRTFEVIRLKDDPAVLLHVERHIRPVRSAGRRSA